jgi:predicted MPP superfamily phosphohydrolase
MKMNFVHLSDLHYRLNWHEDQGVVLNAFFKDLEKQIEKFDVKNTYLIFSGDVVQAGGKSELYEAFIAEFDTKLNEIGITKDQRICVPGNHDVSVDYIHECSLEHRAIVSQTVKDYEFNTYISKQPKLITDKFNNYKVFEYKFAKFGIGHDTISGSGWNISDEIAVYCLNTALYSSGGYDKIDDKSKLCIDTRALYKWVQENSTRVKVLVMHHPIEWLNEWSQVDLKNIIKDNFSLCLSGHVHEQSTFHFINKEKGIVNCSAPPLLTNKKGDLGYSIISVSSTGVEEIYYRQWTNKNSFVTGVNFSDSDDGKIIIQVPQDVKKKIIKDEGYTTDFIEKILAGRLNEALRSFSSQPIFWVEPIISKTNKVNVFSENKTDYVKTDDLLLDPQSVIIQSPPQFGLTCLSHYLIKEAWVKNKAQWVYLDYKSTEWHSIAKAVEKELDFFGSSISDLKCIVLDSWVSIDKNSIKYINKLSSLYPDIAVIVMQTIDDNQFMADESEENPEILNRSYIQLHLLALPRERIRRVVSDYNNVRHIGEEDAVVTKVVSDLDVLNIHRTPLNCLTLLKVSEKSFDESPVNRAEMIRNILFILFNMESIPSYKGRPDLKDCEYVLGKFCEGLIRSNNFVFTRDNFVKTLNRFCEERVISLEVDVVFDVLYSNYIIIKKGNNYCFRFTYWIYYFAAHRMQQNQEFANFIFKDKRYANFPEIIEFYTGIDRSRDDALKVLIEDVRSTREQVVEKVGLPTDMNPFKFFTWNPTTETLAKIHDQISEDVINSGLPDSVKDQYADKGYDQVKPYNQTIQQIFNEYSLNTLMQCAKAASRALRNSDYVEPEIKRELLDEILHCWDEFSKVILAITPALATKGNAIIDGLAVMLLGNFGDTFEKRAMSILRNVPYNVVEWFKSDLYSEKMARLLFERINKEENELIKHELILVIVNQRPQDWSLKVQEYIGSISKNSYYLFNVCSILRNQYKYAFVSPKALREIGYLIKMCVAKHELGTKMPGKEAIKKVPDNALPKRLS